jgi:hypothetical protein
MERLYNLYVQFNNARLPLLVPCILPDSSSTTVHHPQAGRSSSLHPPSSSNISLQIYVWEIYPDMAVFDWYISLAEKSR